MAEAILRRDLVDRGVEAVVSSAGILRDGLPPADEAVEQMRERGLDITGHRSRVISPELISPADLVIAMAREHVREVVVMQPALFARTFTLKELVWRGEDIGPRLQSETLTGWLARMGIDRRPADILGASSDDDVEDPIGQRSAQFKKAAGEIEDLTSRFVQLGWPRESVV